MKNSFKHTGITLTLAAGLFLTPAARAALSFSFDYSDNDPGVGFLDPVNGAARRDALVTAGNLFADLFGSHFSDTATLTISVVSSSTGVASAGTAGLSAPGFGNGEVMRNKVISGGAVDLNGLDNDGFIIVNWANDYVIDPNAPVDFTNGQIDFFSVIDHELTHALGFGSNIPADGSTPGAYSKWDQFLTTKAGVRVVDPLTMTVNLAAYAEAQANGGLFDGPAAAAAYAGGVPLVVNPDISHLNQEAFTESISGRPNALMRSTGTGPNLFVPRIYDPAEVGILRDLGYTPIPEPGTTGVLALGGAALLFRRRKA